MNLNKPFTLIVFNLCLALPMTSQAVSVGSESSAIDVFNIETDINPASSAINDGISEKVEQHEWLIADNTHRHEINEEIEELNHEMSELGKEFNDEMSEMGHELKGLVKMLRSMGDREKGESAFLGILLDEHKGVDSGVLLLGVTPDGPAQNAGLKADDIILQINNNSMQANKTTLPSSKLYNTLKKVKPGEQLTVLIKRNGEEKEIIFSAGKRADHLQHGINFLADDLEKRISKKIHLELDNEALDGIELYPVNSKLGSYFGSEHGMLVLNIPDDNKYNLQQGDILLKIGERTPRSSSQTWRILDSYDHGEKVNLTLMRDKQEIQISINKP